MSRQVVVTGANGWIGGKLAARLSSQGWRVTGVSRTPEQARAKQPGIAWVGVGEAFDDAVQNAGVVVNLAGRHFLERPWDDEFKRAIYESRVELTRRVVQALKQNPGEEKVLINGSGYPVYGDTGNTLVSEEHPVGRSSFLAALDADWENAARDAETFGARVAVMRIGLVFGVDGGAFPVLKQPFDQGMGVVLGTGAQWISWIHIEDTTALLAEALNDPRYSGAVNAAAPHPVKHRDFAQALARAMGKPCEVTVPPDQVRQNMGEASELVLMSSRLEPRKALAFGFRFQFPTIDAALQALLS